MNDRKNGRRHQPLHKKKPPVPNEQEQWQHLPHVLRHDGAVATALRSSKRRALKDDSLSHFWRLLRKELSSLRSHHRWASLAPEHRAEDIKRVFRAVVREDRHGQDTPSARLLRWLLALREDFAGREEHWNSAWAEYLKRTKEYNQLLGDFIPASVRDDAANWAYANNSNTTAQDDWPAYLRRLETVRARPMVGLGTGLPSLDEYTAGLQGVTVLAGETSAGKSSLVLQMSIGTLLQNPTAGILLYGLELPKDTFFTRLYSHFSGVPYLKVIRPGPDERKRLQAAAERLEREILPRLRILDWGARQGYEPLTLDVMKRDVAEMLNRPSVERVLVIVDPLQRWQVLNTATPSDVEEDGPSPRSLTELEADDLRMRMLMQLQEFTRRPGVPDGDPIIAVSGVRKSDHTRKRLTLADVRGSYNTVCEAHCVLLLEQASEASVQGKDIVPVIVSVKKVRDGGVQGDIHLDFHYTLSKFEERRKGVRAKASTATEGQQEEPSKPKRWRSK